MDILMILHQQRAFSDDNTKESTMISEDSNYCWDIQHVLAQVKPLYLWHRMCLSSVQKLFHCLFSRLFSGKLVSPKWKNFKGLKLLWRDKIRLNNAIWRAWYMQCKSSTPSLSFGIQCILYCLVFTLIWLNISLIKLQHVWRHQDFVQESVVRNSMEIPSYIWSVFILLNLFDWWSFSQDLNWVMVVHLKLFMLTCPGEAVVCLHDVRNRICHSRKKFGDVSENFNGKVKCWT